MVIVLDGGRFIAFAATKRKREKKSRKQHVHRDRYSSLPETLISPDCTPLKFSPCDLTKLSANAGQLKFYFNFILMKIIAPRRRAINFSGNITARASDANNRAIKRCLLAKEETELSSLRL